MTELETRLAPARVLAYSPGRRVAFPEHCTVALHETPPVFGVPGAPAHCLGLMDWAGNLVPLLDLRILADGGQPAGEFPAHVLILAWQPAAGAALQHGAICAPSLVTMERVGDEQRCEPPADADGLRACAASHFTVEGCVVPIIDTRLLFGSRLPSGR
jgi:chemotaxis signal transduction protein